MGKPIRRVVTTHEVNGKAVVLFDGTPPQHKSMPDLGVESGLLWVTHSTPAAMDGTKDRGNIDIAIPPPAKGTIFRFVDFHPETAEMKKLDAGHMSASMGEGHAKSGKAWKPRHPGMHRTKSVDYAIVMSGEIDMLLDDSEVHLKTGDVLVQQGTNHAWVNRGKETCRIAFILVDADDPLA